MTETAVAEAPEGAAEDVQIDYEAEAKKMGWTAREEFKGDPNHHIDAETFYNRAVEYMPIAKATIKRLSERLDKAEKEAKKAAEFFSKAEERAYTRALADIRAEQEAAVESGDLEAHRKASEKLDKLEKPAATPKAETVSDEDRAEDFADWGKANKWYATNSVMQAYADAQAAKIAKTKDGFLDRADLDEVAERVKAKFAEDFPDEFGEKARKKPAAVEGVTAPRGKLGGKTFNDLPPEARAMCDKWVKNGTIKSREDYVKGYQW